MPIPAANIIAIQETVRNSGFSPSRPSGMLPNLPSASQSTKTTNRDARAMNSQPVYCITQSSACCDVAARLSLPAKPQITNASAHRPVMPNVALSKDRARPPPRRAACPASLRRSSRRICSQSSDSGSAVSPEVTELSIASCASSSSRRARASFVSPVGGFAFLAASARLSPPGCSSGAADLISLFMAMSGSFARRESWGGPRDGLQRPVREEGWGLVRFDDHDVAVDDLDLVPTHRQFGRGTSTDPVRRLRHPDAGMCRR